MEARADRHLPFRVDEAPDDEHVPPCHFRIEMIVRVVLAQCACEIDSNIVLLICSIHTQIGDMLSVLIVMTPQPLDHIMVAGIRTDELSVNEIPHCIICVGNSGGKDPRSQPPHNKAYWELTLNVVEHIGGNHETLQTLCTEELSERREVRCLNMFQF